MMMVMYINEIMIIIMMLFDNADGDVDDDDVLCR